MMVPVAPRSGPLLAASPPAIPAGEYGRPRRPVAAVKDGETTVATYRCDALGRRVEKAVNGGATTRYLLDGVQVVEEYDGSDAWQARYVYEDGIDQPRCMDRADQADVDGDQNTTEVLRFHYHQQALGCVTEMSEPGGAVGRTTNRVESTENTDEAVEDVIANGGDYVMECANAQVRTWLKRILNWLRVEYDDVCGRAVFRGMFAKILLAGVNTVFTDEDGEEFLPNNLLEDREPRDGYKAGDSVYVDNPDGTPDTANQGANTTLTEDGKLNEDGSLKDETGAHTHRTTPPTALGGVKEGLDRADTPDKKPNVKEGLHRRVSEEKVRTRAGG